MFKRTVVSVVILFLHIAAEGLNAGVPRLINYQGVLTGPGGEAMPDGLYSIVLVLFNSDAGGDAVYEWIDDVQVVDADTEDRRLSLREGPIEECAPFGLATWVTKAELRGVRWCKLGD